MYCTRLALDAPFCLQRVLLEVTPVLAGNPAQVPSGFVCLLFLFVLFGFLSRAVRFCMCVFIPGVACAAGKYSGSGAASCPGPVSFLECGAL